MKKQKLSLNDLKVNSFVTSVEDKKNMIKGGAPVTYQCQVVTFDVPCLISRVLC